MKVEIVGKNGFTPSDSNKDYAIKKLGKLEGILSDYDTVSARVVCKVYKAYHKVEVTIPSVRSGKINQPPDAIVW